MKKQIIKSLILGLLIGHNISSAGEQLVFKPFMPQQQLFAQRDELQDLVKDVWANCLKLLDVKFAGVEEQNPGNEDIMSVAMNFEKQPKTDENISFIKNTVQGVIAKIPINSLRFDQKTKESQEQLFKSLLERVVGEAFVELLLKDLSEPLDWCICIAEYKRIALVLLLVNEIREKFPSKNQQVVYTSFASGNLLLDYIILSELSLSHTNILVNLIDLEYPDIPVLAKKDLSNETPNSLHMIEMKSKQESAEVIDSFKTKIAQVISKKSTNINYNIDVNVYQNAYDYISYVQKNPKEKSNILVLVDPSSFVFGIADFPSLANVINVWIDNESKPVFTIYVPRHNAVYLYQAKRTNSPEIMESLSNILTSLMKTIGANKYYTPKFTNTLLDNSMFDGQQITDELLANNFPKLMKIRANLRKEALKEGYVDHDLLNPLTPIKLGDVSVLLSWGTDAHISFQDLVWNALASNAIIYELYAINPKKQGDNNNQIIKINPEIYKKADVITPNAGAISSQGKIRVLSK